MAGNWIQPDLFEPALAWPFGELAPRSYGMIMADPPWRFRNFSAAGEEKNAVCRYRCMDFNEIASLPVAEVASDDCLLWLWCTAPMLDVQIGVMARWGFDFATSGVWVKKTTHGRTAFGTGYVLRNAHDPFVIGRRGKPRSGSWSVRSVIEAKTRGHTRKPEEALEAAEALTPGARRCELFAWTQRPGWDAWGDEVGLRDLVEGGESQ